MSREIHKGHEEISREKQSILKTILKTEGGDHRHLC